MSVDQKIFTFLGGEVVARKIAPTRKERFNFTALSRVPSNAIDVRLTMSPEKFLTLEYESPNKNAGKWFCNVNGRGRVFDTLRGLEKYIAQKEKQVSTQSAAALAMRRKKGGRIRKQLADALRHARALGLDVQIERPENGC